MRSKGAERLVSCSDSSAAGPLVLNLVFPGHPPFTHVLSKVHAPRDVVITDEENTQARLMFAAFFSKGVIAWMVSFTP